MRVGVNCGSVDPAKKDKYDHDDSITPMLESAWEHCELLDSLGFTRYCVSLKDSDPRKVIEVNRRFAERRPDVPLHLGVTEAGLPPDGIIKTRIAFEQLISRGIGDTIRVSLTVPNDAKPKRSPPAGKSWPTSPPAACAASSIYGLPTLNIITCPSCSRVENEAFIELAQQVKEMTRYAEEHAITIAVMGCRVNGPGETDDADLGLWCGPELRQPQTRQCRARRIPLRPDSAQAQKRAGCANCSQAGAVLVAAPLIRSYRISRGCDVTQMSSCWNRDFNRSLSPKRNCLFSGVSGTSTKMRTKSSR